MRKPLPSISTRTQEYAPCDLPLRASDEPPRRDPPPPRRPADRIKEALLRWLEEEM